MTVPKNICTDYYNPKAKHRIKIVEGEHGAVYYPQWKGWFFWNDYRQIVASKIPREFALAESVRFGSREECERWLKSKLKREKPKIRYVTPWLHDREVFINKEE